MVDHENAPYQRGNGDETYQRATGDTGVLTTNQGMPVFDNQNQLKAGARGPALLDDHVYREKINHFDHERIPERIVHARGSAAAIQWLMHAFGHLKAIGCNEAAKPLLDKAGGEPDEGMTDLAGFAEAAKRRHWTRGDQGANARMIGRLTPIALLACAGCVSTDHLAKTQAPAPVFDPAVFFSGRTEGRGTLSVVLHRQRPTLVRGYGRRAPDGGIVLEQVVMQGGGRPERRTWHLREVASGRWAGTLSDASGPVTGSVTGNRLHLSFAMKGGLKAEQWLYLKQGGQVAENVMVVRKFGIPVARLAETITRE